MSRTPLSPVGPTVKRTFKLPEQLDRSLQAQAKLTGRAVGALIREALEMYLQRKEKR